MEHERDELSTKNRDLQEQLETIQEQLETAKERLQKELENKEADNDKELLALEAVAVAQGTKDSPSLFEIRET